MPVLRFRTRPRPRPVVEDLDDELETALASLARRARANRRAPTTHRGATLTIRRVVVEGKYDALLLSARFAQGGKKVV